jgi:hypothetical protein
MSMEETADGLPPIVVLYREGTSEKAMLLRQFHISASGSAARLSLQFTSGNSLSAEINVDPKTIAPEDDNMSLTEKLLLRFEAAMRGETSRVDLRFCTGSTNLRNREHDNLRPGYAPPRAK